MPRFAYFIGVTVLSVLATACARPRVAPRPPAATATATATAPAPPALIPPALTPADALAALRTAETFDDAHVGYAGELSGYVAAFRVVLVEPNASASFHALVLHGTPAGRLYGAAGLSRRVEIAKGPTLVSWFAANPRGGHCDLAGGCVPLMFVDDGRPAPR